MPVNGYMWALLGPFQKRKPKTLFFTEDLLKSEEQTQPEEKAMDYPIVLDRFWPNKCCYTNFIYF